MSRTIFLLSMLFFSQLTLSQAQSFPFQNTKLSIEHRVDDLVSRLTLQEKADQLMFESPAIPRLAIRKYSWWNECLHGVARNGKATVFPQAIGLAATFDPDLMKRIGQAIADEARAKYNANKMSDYMEQYAGLTFWSPNVNLFRDPRWGRGQETYGEDPYLISRMGVEFVHGLQGEGEIMQVAAMAKHYAVHSGPEKLRHEFDAVVTRYDLWNTYLPAFESLITEANAEGVMGAYNRTNGEVCNAHDYLMNDVLRDKWKFDGYYVSDCWAIQDFYQGHKIVNSKKEAAALALNTGCNLNCGNTYPALLEAIKSGLTSEIVVDKNLKQLLKTRFRLGLFDPEGSVSYDTIRTNKVRSEEHIDLSYEAARKSLVLLKNEKNTLPIKTNVQSVFVTGPMAANAQALLANYYGVSSDMRTMLEGIVDNVSDNTAIRYVQGSLMDRPNINPIDWYSDEAKIADVTIACMGITQLMEGEEGEAIASASFGDREFINLPAHQIEFLRLLRSKANKLVVIITGGSAISSPEVHELADAILYAWYPGEQGGQAVGDVLFGKYSPSGKLPVTFVKKLEDLPPYEDYNMIGRTYRYIDKDPLYPFGFGLTYSKVNIDQVKSSKSQISPDSSIMYEVDLSNIGERITEEVLQVYIGKVDRKPHEPIYQLKRFQRLTLQPSSTEKIQLELTSEDFEYYDDNGNNVLIPGKYKIHFGLSSPSNRNIELGGTNGKSMVIEVK